MKLGHVENHHNYHRLHSESYHNIVVYGGKNYIVFHILKRNSVFEK
jgi:hypothetical protein